jgi:hypothetical protein
VVKNEEHCLGLVLGSNVRKSGPVYFAYTLQPCSALAQVKAVAARDYAYLWKLLRATFGRRIVLLQCKKARLAVCRMMFIPSANAIFETAILVLVPATVVTGRWTAG